MNIFQKIVVRIVYGFLVLGLMIGVGELFLRISWTNPYKGFLDRFVYLREPKPFTNIAFQWPWGKIRFQVDANGFIYPSMVYEKPDYTIAFMGGSTTECLAVEDKKRFPYLVGEILSNHFRKKFNSLNCGLSGANSQHSLNTLLNKIRFYNPNICIFMHVGNDLGVLVADKTYSKAKVLGDYHINFISITNYLASKYFLIGLIRQLYLDYSQQTPVKEAQGKISAVKPPSSGPVPVSIECANYISSYEKNLRMFVHICRDNGIVPILMTEAKTPSNAGQIFNFFQIIVPKDDCFSQMNEAVRAVAIELDVFLVDLDSIMSKQPDCFYDGMHYSQKGSEKVADIISKKLVESGIIPPTI